MSYYMIKKDKMSTPNAAGEKSPRSLGSGVGSDLGL